MFKKSRDAAMNISAHQRIEMSSPNGTTRFSSTLLPSQTKSHAPTTMRMKVHIRERTFVVSCGDGGQRISWLANVGIIRYDDKTKGMELGAPRGVRLEDGTRLNMDDIINTRLAPGTDVWVILKEDQIHTDDSAQGEAVAMSVSAQTAHAKSKVGTPRIVSRG